MRVATSILFIQSACAKIFDLEVDGGALANLDDTDTWITNKNALESSLAALEPGDTLVIPNKTFHLMGGVRVDNVKGATIQIDGTLSYANSKTNWPLQTDSDKVQECFYGRYWEDVTFTSSGTGTMDGRGDVWWGVPGVGYLVVGENRPRLFSLDHATNILFENILLKDSPYWTFWMTAVNGLEVRNSQIDARRDPDATGHDIVELSAFNTDGFDVEGNNVWIHDVQIWNQDDCIAAKDNSFNMVFERIEASGLGMTIGSIGSDHKVRNITFRDIHMKNTVKGIYSKFRGGTGEIADITFENIVMDSPSQYPIWVGPAQQSDSSNPCAAHPCSLCWPQSPTAQCNGVVEAKYINITIRNITVNNAAGSPGVLIGGSETNPIQNLVLEDVVFTNPGQSVFASGAYFCKNVNGVAKGTTWPVPDCLQDETGTCRADGECKAYGSTCCSGVEYDDAGCHTGFRCGPEPCVSAGACTSSQTSCCSGVGHQTFACGRGVKCDTAELIV